MKTSFDSFLSLTSTGSDVYLTSPLLASQADPQANSLALLPEDIILQIFSFLQSSTLCQICSVSKACTKLASSDFIWQAIAESILLSEELAAKSQVMAYKDACKESLALTKLDNSDVVWKSFAESLSSCGVKLPPKSPDTSHKDYCKDRFRDILSQDDNIGFLSKEDCWQAFGKMAVPSDSYLKPRDRTFMHKIKQMQLPRYKILTPTETKALCQRKDTASLIQAVCFDVDKPSFDFHHAACQQLGDTKYEFLNCTDHVISFCSEGFLMIDNKSTTVTLTRIDCQFLIYADQEKIWFYNSDKGFIPIYKICIPLIDLKLDDYTQLAWEEKAALVKFIPGFSPFY